MEFTFLDPYLNPSAERKTIKRYATVRSGVGIEAMNEVLLNMKNKDAISRWMKYIYMLISFNLCHIVWRKMISSHELRVKAANKKTGMRKGRR